MKFPLFASHLRPLRPRPWAGPWFVAVLLAATSVHAGDDLRLGSAVRPISESLHLVLDADKSDYSGTAHLELEIKSTLQAFRMHAEAMSLDKIELRPLPVNTRRAPIVLKAETGEVGLVTLRSDKPLAPGRYTLDIEFKNDFSTNANSLYRMIHDGHGYLFTQFEANDAREAFPCFDEPGFKIPWQMTLVVPEKHLAIFNTPIASEMVKEGARTLVFKKTPPLPSYLLAVATGPLETVEIPNLGVPGRVVTVAGQSRLATLAAQTTPPLLAAMERWFGQKYPFEKLDLLAVPEYWYGAMENPGAITFAADILLVDPEAASLFQRRRLASITAHELAHMWFGDLVTMAWWDDLWLNESFADWLGDKIAQQVHPEFKIELNELSSIHGTMVADARPSALAIQRPITPTDNVLENVGTQYNKGKAVLGMFEQWVGAEVFRKGVVAYIEGHEWGSATAADLWQALAKVSGQDIAGAMATFLDQPGLPLVTMEPLADGRLRMQQQRLLNAEVRAPAQNWKIPVSLRYSDGKSTRTKTVLLASGQQDVDLGVNGSYAWILPDADARGYYRWSLPADLRAKLIESSATTMNPRERIACLGNLSALLDAGTLHGDEYLAALAHFANDPEPNVIASIAGGMNKVRLAFVPAEMEDEFAVYVRRTLGPALGRYGIEPKPAEDPAIALVRPTVVAWVGEYGNDAKLLSRATQLARSYLEDPKAVDASMSGTVLRLAALNGDRALFDTYRTRFEAAQVPAERTRYLNALGSFRDRAIVETMLRYALEGPLRPQEVLRLPSDLTDTALGRDRAYRWMTENYDTIVKRTPKEFIAFLPNYASGCEAERLEAARVFFSDPTRESPGSRNTLAKVGDSVGDCLRLREREGPRVADYLTQLVGER